MSKKEKQRNQIILWTILAVAVILVGGYLRSLSVIPSICGGRVNYVDAYQSDNGLIIPITGSFSQYEKDMPYCWALSGNKINSDEAFCNQISGGYQDGMCSIGLGKLLSYFATECGTTEIFDTGNMIPELDGKPVGEDNKLLKIGLSIEEHKHACEIIERQDNIHNLNVIYQWDGRDCYVYNYITERYGCIGVPIDKKIKASHGFCGNIVSSEEISFLGNYKSDGILLTRFNECPNPEYAGAQIITGQISFTDQIALGEEVIECTNDELKTCPDGKQIINKYCINNKYIDSGIECSSSECTTDEIFVCPDSSVIIVKECVNGKLVETENMCTTLPEKLPTSFYLLIIGIVLVSSFLIYILIKTKRK